METLPSINRYESEIPTVLTIGTFDGVHIGHQKILERLLEEAQQRQVKSLVLTFFPHPRRVLQKDSDLQWLTTLEEKKQILDRMGLDVLVVQPFTEEFSRLSPEEYIEEVLVKALKVQKIIIGYDHRFGRNRKADITDLIRFGKEFGFEVEQIAAQDIEEVAVSSTKIRRALSEGAIDTAHKYLGYPYLLTGTVVKGKGIGKTLGFPTANVELSEEGKLVPGNGVYVIQFAFDKKSGFGMMNIGTNPTLLGESRKIEIHLFDIDENLYGKSLQVGLLHRLRDEQKFRSLEELQAQLDRDRQEALTYIKNRGDETLAL